MPFKAVVVCQVLSKIAERPEYQCCVVVYGIGWIVNVAVIGWLSPLVDETAVLLFQSCYLALGILFLACEFTRFDRVLMSALVHRIDWWIISASALLFTVLGS